MSQRRELQVFYHETKVGTLVLTRDKKVAFSYDSAWLENGFSINPFSLPLRQQVFVPTKNYFDGLFGTFADSLPDAWGNVLLDRLLRKNGIPADSLSVLDRLAIVGSSGMGALTYRPEQTPDSDEHDLDLDDLAMQCRDILNAQPVRDLDELYRLGGTSGGARPKIMTRIDGVEYIIKFPAYSDGMDAGKMEYDYSICARACGIVMPATRLFPSEISKGYFGIERFDRVPQPDSGFSQSDSVIPQSDSGFKRVHMLTAAALLELDFEQPSLDYHSLMKLTKILTMDYQPDIENMFRRMCFNVFAHNRDDHSKNFAYIYDEEQRVWRLSPAYDLTYSSTYYGEHTTSVDGNGRNPGRKELLAVGRAAGLKKKLCEDLIDEVQSCVHAYLGEYLKENGDESF